MIEQLELPGTPARDERATDVARLRRDWEALGALVREILEGDPGRVSRHAWQDGEETADRIAGVMARHLRWCLKRKEQAK